MWAVAVKEVRQARRDPVSLLLLLAMPAFMLLLYGYAINLDVRHVAIAVQDRDHTQTSRRLLEAFRASGYFDIVADLPSGTDLDQVLERREARCILVIPPGFGADLTRGADTDVQLLIDGTDSATASTVIGYARALVSSSEWNEAARLALMQAPPIDYRPRVWYNPELRSTQFLVPGLIGFILMLTAVLSTALSVVREKERGTMEQIRMTGIRPLELIIGKTLPYLAISLLATASIIAAARLLFGIEVRGSLLDLFAATLVYLVGALGLGLLVSTFASSQALAFQIGILLSMLPAIFLSGFIFAIRSMPIPVQLVTYLVPARYFLVIVRGVMLKGADLSAYTLGPETRPELVFLGLHAALTVGLAWLRLSRREA
jgi:ABC-2 type transport system permease protein